MIPSGMDPNRPPGPGLGPRMSSPRHMGPGGPMGPYGPPMRPPMGGPLPPMGGRAPGPWPPTTGPAMSPGSAGFNGPPGAPGGPPGPPSQGEPNSNSGDGMYGMMKTPTGGSLPGVSKTLFGFCKMIYCVTFMFLS